MDSSTISINLPLTFNQLVDIVKQLPYKEKLKLCEVLRKETMQNSVNEGIMTYVASEKVLSKDWLLPQEDEAWKDL